MNCAIIDSHSDQAASEAVRQLMFIERVASEIGVQIERLD
jgi:molecular chaperone HscB